MSFCSPELAVRIERAECELLDAAVAHAQRRLPLAWRQALGGGIAVITAPGSPLNKVAGLGFAPLEPAAYAAVAAEHRRRGVPMQVELSTLAAPEVGEFLTGHGHRLVGVENVLGRPVDGAVVPTLADLRIEVVAAAERPQWLAAMAAGFAVPDQQGVPSHESFDHAALEQVLADFVGAPGIVCFAARRGGAIVGAASLRLAGGIAQLCGAATLPAHRRRGVQSALLAQRLAYAAARGAELAVMTAQPGSRSQQNAHRQGFALLYARNVLVAAPG